MRIPDWRAAARVLASALLAGALGGCASVVRKVCRKARSGPVTASVWIVNASRNRGNAWSNSPRR